MVFSATEGRQIIYVCHQHPLKKGPADEAFDQFLEEVASFDRINSNGGRKRKYCSLTTSPDDMSNSAYSLTVDQNTYFKTCLARLATNLSQIANCPEKQEKIKRFFDLKCGDFSSSSEVTHLQVEKVKKFINKFKAGTMKSANEKTIAVTQKLENLHL